jgi:hypothetical protein
LPPSEIAATWSADELQNAEVLADLEGWGQQKRMVAKLCAEVHNVGIIGRHWQYADKGSPPPKMLVEGQFLPRKVYKLNIAKAVDKKKVSKSIQQTVSQTIASMAGF